MLPDATGEKTRHTKDTWMNKYTLFMWHSSWGTFYLGNWKTHVASTQSACSKQWTHVWYPGQWHQHPMENSKVSKSLHLLSQELCGWVCWSGLGEVLQMITMCAQAWVLVHNVTHTPILHTFLKWVVTAKFKVKSLNPDLQVCYDSLSLLFIFRLHNPVWGFIWLSVWLDLDAHRRLMEPTSGCLCDVSIHWWVQIWIDSVGR